MLWSTLPVGDAARSGDFEPRPYAGDTPGVEFPGNDLGIQTPKTVLVLVWPAGSPQNPVTKQPLLLRSHGTDINTPKATKTNALVLGVAPAVLFLIASHWHLKTLLK